MLPYRDSRITWAILAIFFVLLLGYAYFEAQGLLFGPSIAVASGTTEVHDPLVTIRGQAERIASLSLNGNAVQVTEDGAFSQDYLLSPGYNRITLEAKDKYGRTRTRVLEIVYTPQASSSTASSASSTPGSVSTSTAASSTTSGSGHAGSPQAAP